MMRRALAAVVPVTMAGVLQLALGATSASAAVSASAPAPHSSLLSGVLQVLSAPATSTGSHAPKAHGAPVPTTPAGSASSHGLTLGLLGGCVSCTSASAAPGHGSAGATGLQLLGQTLAGGASAGHGAQSGSLLSLPSNPLLGLDLAGWMADSTSGATSASGSSTSALTDLALGGTLADASLLHSSSQAGVAGAAGSGGSATDAATVSLLDNAVSLDLLHSGTGSNGIASSFLASVDGTEVGATANSTAVPVSIPGVLDLALLQAQSAAGQGGTGSAAVGTISGLLGAPGTTASVLGSSSTSSNGPAASHSGPTASGAASGGHSSIITILPGAGTVPDTGSVFGLAGLGLLAAGGSIVVASGGRRRRPAMA